jgi:AAA+ ATPase superfamily predicted ATPase
MTKDNFFGRTLYLDILEKRVLGLKEGYRQNIAITGDELVGKTALIHKFLNKFCDNQVILLYLEVRQESLNSFVRRFIGVLLYNFLSASGIPLREDFGFLVSKSGKYIPRTIEKIESILTAVEKRKKINIFTDLLSLLESVHQETGKFSVIIFDEFHNLENIGFNNLYKEWSKLLITQKSTLYIIVSSLKFRTQRILSGNLSLLFGNFEVINVEPFDTKSAETFLNLNLKGLNLDKGLKNFIVHYQ